MPAAASNALSDSLPAGASTRLPPNRIDRELRLKFADFVPFIPKSLLKTEVPSGDVDLTFDLAEVEDLLANGCSRVPVAWLRQRTPFFFCDSASANAFATILFPWQKVRFLLKAALHPDQLTETAEYSGLTPTGGKCLASIYQRHHAELRQQRKAAPPEVSNSTPVPAVPARYADPAPNEPEANLLSPLRAEAYPHTAAAAALSAKPAAPAERKLPVAEVVRQRDVALRELTRFKAEAERHLAAARAELKSMTEERDDALAALQIFSDYENEALAQLDFEKSVQVKQLERAAAEMEDLQAQLAAARELTPERPAPELLVSEPSPPQLTLPGPNDLGVDRPSGGNTLPSSSLETSSSDVSLPGAPRRSGSSWRGWQVASLSMLAALAGGALVWGWPLLPRLMPPSAVLATDAPKLAPPVMRASPANVSSGRGGRKTLPAPAPVPVMHTASR